MSTGSSVLVVSGSITGPTLESFEMVSPLFHLSLHLAIRFPWSSFIGFIWIDLFPDSDLVICHNVLKSLLPAHGLFCFSR